MKVFTGTGATQGIAFGKAKVIESSFSSAKLSREISPDQKEEEIKRLDVAKSRALEEIRQSETKGVLLLNEEMKKIFETHRMIINDKKILPDAINRIHKESINAEGALLLVMNHLEKAFAGIQDAYIKARFNDIRQVLERILSFLAEDRIHKYDDIDDQLILIKEDFSPTEILNLMNNNIAGIATEYGGEKSHTAIICDSLGIPLLVGLKGITDNIKDFDELILDAEEKILILNPGKDTLLEKEKRNQFLKERDEKLQSLRNEKTTLADHSEVKLEANVDFAEECQLAYKFNADGIGLLRTEIVFMSHTKAPDEMEQYRVLKSIVESMQDKYVTIRTWDLGADKTSVFFPGLHQETNPALGIRAIRVCLRNKDFFRVQIRTLIRLAMESNIRVLLPMITNVGEIREVMQMFWEEAEHFKLDKLPCSIGAMIETPAAAINVQEITNEVDFISIGSNDLIQYTLGIDRTNEYVSELYTPYHPSILKILEEIITVADILNKPVSVCGEIASDPVMQLILLGMGEVGLSMNSNRILITRKYLRKFNLDFCRKIAFQFLCKRTAQECLDYRNELMGNYRETFEAA